MAHMVPTAHIIRKSMKVLEVFQFKLPFIMLICYWCHTEGRSSGKPIAKLHFYLLRQHFDVESHSLTHTRLLPCILQCGATPPSFNLLKDAAENRTTETHRFVLSVMCVCILPPCGEAAYFSWSMPFYCMSVHRYKQVMTTFDASTCGTAAVASDFIM